MREVISLNGKAPIALKLNVQNLRTRKQTFKTDQDARTVGQAGCQIANSCWEVSSCSLEPRNLALRRLPAMGKVGIG